MAVNVYYRWNDLDKRHEYYVHSPLTNINLPHWNYWLWFYLGKWEKGLFKKVSIHCDKSYLEIKPFKVYKNTIDAETVAIRILNAIQKHHFKKY